MTATQKDTNFSHVHDKECEGQIEPQSHGVEKSSSSRLMKKRLSCVYCNESFADAKSLADHLPSHAKGKKKLACSFCPEIFDDPDELSRHRLAHLKDKNVFISKQSPCEEGDTAEVEAGAGEPSEVVGGYNEHMECEPLPGDLMAEVSVAEVNPVVNEVLIKVEVPDESYSQHCAPIYAPLINDTPVAPKSRDFICPDCEAGFMTLNKLAAHARRCHPYECQDCQRTFKWLDELNAHREVYFMKPCYRWSRCPKLAFSHQK